jgi:hypothetical protein
MNMKTNILHYLSRRRLIVIFIISFVLAGSVVGYASQSQNYNAPILAGYGVNGPGALRVPGASQEATYLSSTAAAVAGPSGSYSTSFGGRMVELEAALTVQVSDVKAASDQAAQVTALFGGYVASSYFDASGSAGTIVLRVPESNFTSALRSLSSFGIVKAQSISSNDVTEQYVNLQAQLDSYSAEQTTLLRILNSSATVKEALDTENAIQIAQAQINDLEGQLRVMQRLVAFGTINVQLIQPPQNPTLDFGNAFNSALLAFYTVTKGMLILGASLVPIAMIGGVVYVPYRHFSRKKPKPIEAG